MLDFPTWFSSGCYGGLVCCMCAIVVNALYTAFRRRGTTLQLAGVIVICVIAALLLLPVIIWYNMRFSVYQGALRMAEVEVALAYVALCGWVLPLSVTATYCLFTLPRLNTNSVHMPRQKRTTRFNSESVLNVPRHKPGTVEPFVYQGEVPWGWLEYRGGNFQGQRLALKRAIVTIGRDEDNDIWIDDDLASRHHAELACDQGKVYITDCDSLNGVLLNGRRIYGSELVSANDLLEIGSHRFIFVKAQSQDLAAELDDPLLRHKWPSPAASLVSKDSEELPATRALEEQLSPVADLIKKSQNEPTDTKWQEASVVQRNSEDILQKNWQAAQAFSAGPQRNSEEIVDKTWLATHANTQFKEPDKAGNEDWHEETAELDHAVPLTLSSGLSGACVFRDGELAGKKFLLDRPLLVIGRGFESDVVINDASISRRHAQFTRQADGHYVQDLASRNGTKVNEQPLLKPYLLRPGDIVSIGNVSLQYISVPMAPTAALTDVITPLPSPPITMSGPMPLRLPSKQKTTQ